MKVQGSGPDGMLNVGQEYDIDDSMGRELVDGGYAELIPEPLAAEEKPKPKRTRKAAAKETEE